MHLKHKNLEIRLATVNDAEYLHKYWSEDSWNTTTLEELQTMLSNGNTQYMIEVHGQLIGDIHYGEVEDNGAEIGIYIRNKEERGKGYGLLALRLFIDALFNLGYSKIVLNTGGDNKSMRHIAEKKLGLKPIVHEDVYQEQTGTYETCVEYVLESKLN